MRPERDRAGKLLCRRKRRTELRREQPRQMPERLEAGTANVHGIAGLLAAVEWLEETGISEIHRRETELMQRFYRGVCEIPNVKVYGDAALCSPGERAPVIALNIGGLPSDEVCDELAQEYGTRCAGRRSLCTADARSFGNSGAGSGAVQFLLFQYGRRD